MVSKPAELIRVGRTRCVDDDGLTWRGLMLRRRHIPWDKIEGFKSESASSVGPNGISLTTSLVQVLGARGRRLGGLGPGLRGGADDAAKRLEALRERHLRPRPALRDQRAVAADRRHGHDPRAGHASALAL
jgi:Bacterial PH domain